MFKRIWYSIIDWFAPTPEEALLADQLKHCAEEGAPVPIARLVDGQPCPFCGQKVKLHRKDPRRG